MTSPVSTSDGTVTATYNAAGCLGTDLVQAATTVDGTALSVSDTVTVLATSGATISLGTGSGGSFSAGDLDIAITSLSAGGTTGITVNLADSDNGNLYQTPTAITFTANCTTSTNHGSIDSPVASSGGSVSTDYTALGCNGDVTITASATVDGEATTATGTITVAVGTANSLQFVSADPANIALQGYSTGDRPEVSTVTFKLLDTDNNPLQGELVNFTLNTGVGGITLTSASGTTNASGLVTTKVNSGNVATTVRVTATLDSDNTIATQSDTLTISTGIADQNSFSIASNRLSPEALIHNGPTDIESCDEANAQCSQISMIASTTSTTRFPMALPSTSPPRAEPSSPPVKQPGRLFSLVDVQPTETWRWPCDHTSHSYR
ncbi:hypothetical protein [Candidatus Reidiella endopervernicosa]|uniref:Big-1 domain-containing protein n=1 Tax=Candidatus Reidiella endopervernicosa TaxID=2738883 RepID=A0A6N0HTG6_9GAMM|nr:hypothetical protein [Candidatus Reidiella endopervernicosa]QKQ25679.1 hypothetical protein HUE57_04755 [Candidatus Reidiella endopervernicosa]